MVIYICYFFSIPWDFLFRDECEIIMLFEN